MAKPEWGSKRTCQGCGARFYDLNRNPVVCPKCGAEQDLSVVARSGRGRAAPEAKAPPKKKAPVADVAAVADDDLALDDEEIEAVEDEDEEDDLIEDASELGEDDAVIDVVEDDEDEKGA